MDGLENETMGRCKNALKNVLRNEEMDVWMN